MAAKNSKGKKSFSHRFHRWERNFNREIQGGKRGLNFEPDSYDPSGYVQTMSVTEIINELPKLTEMERRAVREKLLELAAKNEDVRLCNQTAHEDALQLDEMEEKAGKIELPDFRARAKKIFPKPIPKSLVKKLDKMIRGG